MNLQTLMFLDLIGVFLYKSFLTNHVTLGISTYVLGCIRINFLSIIAFLPITYEHLFSGFETVVRYMVMSILLKGFIRL